MNQVYFIVKNIIQAHPISPHFSITYYFFKDLNKQHDTMKYSIVCCNLYTLSIYESYGLEFGEKANFR